VKQLLSIIFLPLYLLSSGGVYITQHFCEGELCTTSIATVAPSCCCEANNDDAGCCENVSKYFKVADAQYNAQQSIVKIFSLSFITCTTANFIAHNNFITVDRGQTQSNIHAPPLIVNEVPLYVLQCSLKLCA
jgi:hypothetical protein